MKDIFRYPVNDIPLRFTKYFITIVNKTCASKEIMREVSETRVHELVEQLLTRLLIENLDKIGENKEGELILKNLNSSMLRMLENCQHTYIFCTLFGLLKKYKDDPSLPKLPGLIIKCLLKLSKIMDKLIEKLDMEKFLVAVHEYLAVINHDSKTQNDDLGIRIVKTLINEVVKLKREKVWVAYAVIEDHPVPDNHIKKWV
jgi:cytoskeleton-associated protein 5